VYLPVSDGCFHVRDALFCVADRCVCGRAVRCIGIGRASLRRRQTSGSARFALVKGARASPVKLRAWVSAAGASLAAIYSCVEGGDACSASSRACVLATCACLQLVLACSARAGAFARSAYGSAERASGSFDRPVARWPGFAGSGQIWRARWDNNESSSGARLSRIFYSLPLLIHFQRKGVGAPDPPKMSAGPRSDVSRQLAIRAPESN